MNRKVLIYLLLILIVLFVIFFAMRMSELKETLYTDINAARKAGAIESGWIPRVIPESSTDIYERHDLDTNAVWLKFKFDKRDINRLVVQIEEVKPKEIAAIEFSSPNIRWWPKELNKDSIIKGQPSLRIYKYDRVFQFADKRQQAIHGIFVIDWNSNIAYYWQ